MHQTVISAIEIGRVRPTRSELERIAKALDVEPAEALLDPVVFTMPEVVR